MPSCAASALTSADDGSGDAERGRRLRQPSRPPRRDLASQSSSSEVRSKRRSKRRAGNQAMDQASRWIGMCPMGLPWTMMSCPTASAHRGDRASRPTVRMRRRQSRRRSRRTKQPSSSQMEQPWAPTRSPPLPAPTGRATAPSRHLQQHRLQQHRPQQHRPQQHRPQQHRPQRRRCRCRRSRPLLTSTSVSRQTCSRWRLGQRTSIGRRSRRYSARIASRPRSRRSR